MMIPSLPNFSISIDRRGRASEGNAEQRQPIWLRARVQGQGEEEGKRDRPAWAGKSKSHTQDATEKNKTNRTEIGSTDDIRSNTRRLVPAQTTGQDRPISFSSVIDMMKPRRIVRTEDEIDRVVVTAGGARGTNLDLGLLAVHVSSVTPAAYHPRRFTSTAEAHLVIAMYTAIPIVTLESQREGGERSEDERCQRVEVQVQILVLKLYHPCGPCTRCPLQIGLFHRNAATP